MSSMQQIILNPIGYVRTDAIGNQVKDKKRVAQIVLNKDLIEALDGIEEFSHVFVLFWLNEAAVKPQQLKFHPRGREDMPLLGVFALRTNQRPNPIGLTLVELLRVESNILTVRGLDAYDGTSVLDIKPFDSWDCVSNPRVPNWWIKLNK